ncbi:hypothetical protein BB560_005491, partial [Smittium megazygosporum]
MSFKFKWEEISPEFVNEVKNSLSTSLDKKAANLPPNIVGGLQVTGLDFGKIPPVLEILQVVDIDDDLFKAIFNLSYNGDMDLIFQTSVQANPLVDQAPATPAFRTDNILFAKKPLIVPMFLKISSIFLKGIIALSISKRNGVTLVFKNKPLQSVSINSSFDNVPFIQKKLQSTIENVLQNLLVEELPKIIHDISVRRIAEQELALEKERLEKERLEKMAFDLTPQLIQSPLIDSASDRVFKN